MSVKSLKEKSTKLLKQVLAVSNYGLRAAAEADRAKWDKFAAETKLMNDNLALADDMCDDEKPDHFLDRWIDAHEDLMVTLGITVPVEPLPGEE